VANDAIAASRKLHTPCTPLLVIYLRGGFRRKKIFGVIPCAAAVAFVILEFLELYLLLRDLE
jgi:hypothetical protein